MQVDGHGRSNFSWRFEYRRLERTSDRPGKTSRPRAAELVMRPKEVAGRDNVLFVRIFPVHNCKKGVMTLIKRKNAHTTQHNNANNNAEHLIYKMISLLNSIY